MKFSEITIDKNDERAYVFVESTHCISSHEYTIVFNIKDKQNYPVINIDECAYG